MLRTFRVHVTDKGPSGGLPSKVLTVTVHGARRAAFSEACRISGFEHPHAVGLRRVHK